MAVIGPIRRTPWGRPLPVSVGLALGPVRTYAEFQTQIQSLATDGARLWSGSLPSGTAGGKFTTTRTADSMSDFYGSPWQPATTNGFLQQSAGVGRLMQHALTLDAFNQQVANNGMMYFEVAVLGGGRTLVSVSRNGYTSLGDPGTFTTSRITDLIRWDFTLNKAFRSNPSAGTAETEYTW